MISKVELKNENVQSSTRDGRKPMIAMKKKHAMAREMGCMSPTGAAGPECVPNLRVCKHIWLEWGTAGGEVRSSVFPCYQSACKYFQRDDKRKSRAAYKNM